MTAYSEAAKEAKKIFSPLMPNLKFVPGNHDSGDKPSLVSPAGPADKDSLETYRKHFGEDFYSFEFNDIKFIIINSSLVNNTNEDLIKEIGWKQSLQTANKVEPFFFSHYPPFINDIDEDSHYDNYAEPGRKWLLDLVKQYNIEAVFLVMFTIFSSIGSAKQNFIVIRLPVLQDKIIRHCSLAKLKMNTEEMIKENMEFQL